MRRKRVLKDGARYHVAARANRKEMILQPEAIKKLFLSTVKRAKVKYRFTIGNFCLMNNHFHMIIQPAPGYSLSRIMQWILGVFAMSYNRRSKLVGHVWMARFISHILSSLKDYLRAFEYIDQNPVRAGLVLESREWEFGGLWHFIHGRADIVGIFQSLISAFIPRRPRLSLPSD
jgi:putative transposase